jgi:hypothetical protein
LFIEHSLFEFVFWGEGVIWRKHVEVEVAVTKERGLFLETIEKEVGGHKREGFVPGDARK